VECWVSYGDILNVSENTFFGGPYNAVQVQAGSDSAFVDASRNYWGTTNAQEIAAMILDSNDSIQYKSSINTANPLSAPSINTPSTSTTLVADRYITAALEQATQEATKLAEEAKQIAAEKELERAKAATENAQKIAEEQKKQAEAIAAAEAKIKKATSGDEIELDGELEDPVGDLSATYRSASQRYSISVSTNLAGEAFVIRATRKGAKTLQYKITTNDEGEFKFATRNKLKGYTLILLFNGERLDSFRVK
jgi:hypothetical protein